MNMIPRNRSLSVVMSEAAMLLTLDKIIANAMIDDGSDPAVDVMKRTHSDKAFHEAFVRWGLKLRSAQLNEEDVGQRSSARSGRSIGAPSSSTNSNGDGHGRIAAHGGQEAHATPLLLNEDDRSLRPVADRGHEQDAPSSSPNGDGDGQTQDAKQSRLLAAAPSPSRGSGPRPGARFNVKPNPPRFTSEADVQNVVRRDLAMSIMVPDASGKLIPLRMIRLSECPAYFTHSAAVASITKDLYARHRYKPENMHKRLGELEPDFAYLERRAHKEASEHWAAEVRS